MKQTDKMYNYMLAHPEVEWWKASYFTDNQDCYIGYEASARMSDLVREHPDMIETKKEGRFRLVKIRRG